MKKRVIRVRTRNHSNYFNHFVSRKRSQAFLITAVIFIAIVSAIIAMHNYSKKTEFSTFPFIAEEIQIESEKVMDYALLNPEDAEAINKFTEDVSDYVKKDGIDIYFIDNDACSNIDSKPCIFNNGNKITATIDGTEYSFPKYNSGNPFYFIMIKEKEGEGEKYVYTNA